MKLYLVQHGEALEKDVDPARPLTERGRAEVERVAAFLRGVGVRAAKVLHSGKLRAEQTAELLAPAVGAAGRVEKTGDIDPLDPPLAFELTVNEWTEDTMVVGHMPFLGKLVSRLVADNEIRATTAFCPGAVVCLESGGDNTWLIAWMVRPELVSR
jgi:phosphohistidine phosphatase